jgi:phosphohistidine phosphatase
VRDVVPSWYYAQSAAVPYRVVGDATQVLLITSRRGKRWTVPKGVIEPSLTAATSAAKEAFEEAGIRGDIGSAPLGTFEYEKWDGRCHVEVYPLLVREVFEVWPESDRRKRRWQAIDEAIAEVEWEGLQQMLRALAQRLHRQELLISDGP